MPATPSSKSELFRFTFDRAQYEHDHLSETWKRLDDKAQATATIAGIFMAAAFAFLQSSAVQLTSPQKWVLCAGVLFLVVAITLSVFSMLIQEVSLPPTTARAAKMVADVLAGDPKEFEERYDGLLADTIDPWVQVNAALTTVIARKGRQLLWGQRSLLLAAFSIAILTIAVLVC
jgi:lipopolysaccharide export LptBFGC system permease protein LptF